MRMWMSTAALAQSAQKTTKRTECALPRDSRLHTLVEEIRAAEDNVLLVDAGDQFQGTLFYNVFKADIITATMNTLGYDAMTVGNHEFDNGPAELARLADGANFPIVSTNLDVSAEPTAGCKIEPL